jgi:hypothetical protein
MESYHESDVGAIVALLSLASLLLCIVMTSIPVAAVPKKPVEKQEKPEEMPMARRERSDSLFELNATASIVNRASHGASPDPE